MGRGGSGHLINSTDREELEALLLLRLLPGVGDRTAVRLLRVQGSARRAMRLSRERFRAAAGAEAEQARRSAQLKARVQRILERCQTVGIRVLCLGDEGYPARLHELVDPPPILFCRGDTGLLRGRTVAIVGSRRATPEGRRASERISRELSDWGVTVVSGLALGIDGAAHRGALAGVGSTVAVLGSGPDRPHPPGNRPLFRQILERGLVVSEFPPGEPARPYHFPRRNRVLAGLSQAVIVVEAARRSGALITVDHALDLGLEVFAVPGSVERSQAEGVHALLRDGAHILTCGSDLLEVMQWHVPTSGSGGARLARWEDPGSSEHTPDLSAVQDALDVRPRSLDEIVRASGLSHARVLAALTRLELIARARREGSGWKAGSGVIP